MKKVKSTLIITNYENLELRLDWIKKMKKRQLESTIKIGTLKKK